MQQLNLKDLVECYNGSNEIVQIMYGTRLVWEIGKCVYLGYGSSFTLTESIYKKYKSLTVDDFFISPAEGYLIETSYSCGCWDPQYASGTLCKDSAGNVCCKSFSDTATFSKSWTASTGKFTCTFGGKGVYVWIIPNSAKHIANGTIKKVGTGQTFNLASIAKDYQSCTKNNFLFRTINSATSSESCCSYNCPNSISFTKSYNASTGDLVAQTGVRRNLIAGSLNNTPYYIPTTFIAS